MKITSSYKMKLTGDLKALENSIRIYRDALHFVIPIVHTHWDEMKDFEYSHQRMMYVEKFIQPKLIKLSMTLTRNFQSSLRIYVDPYSIVQLASSPLIVVT